MQIAILDHKDNLIYTVNMLKNSKISQYKIKKILKYYSEDLTASEASKLMNMNIKTINRYYILFREALLRYFHLKVNIEPEMGEYIGFLRGEYGDKNYFKIYKFNEKTFLFTMSPEKPKSSKYAALDKDFEKYLNFCYKRLVKFHGFSAQNYKHQLLECLFRYNYSPSEFFNLVLEQMRKTPLK